MSPSPLRVGSVPYLVGRPLDAGLEEEPDIELVRAVPSKLVPMLRAGEVDCALVSSIELFRMPGYGYVDGPAVVGYGPVASVQLFLRRPVDLVRSVALDPASRTAATLVQVLLDPRSGLAHRDAAPEFVEVADGEDPRASVADAWLRIGDPALCEALGEDAPPVFNPSAEWTRRTGLPFVFAAWIVRPGVDLAPHLAAFERARARGLERLAELAELTSERLGLPLEGCRRYFLEECRYDASAELEPALFAFRDAAAKLGLCRGDLTPRAIGRESLEIA
jgi:chorismate dehydratase